MDAKRLVAAVLVIFGLVCVASAEKVKKEDKEPAIKKADLVGTWKAVKGVDEGEAVTVSMTSDGKANMTHKKDGKEQKVSATYKLTGKKIAVTRKVDGEDKTSTYTIVSLSATKLVTKDDKGKEMTFEKVKAKGRE
jgi:uncharacterized protein (TIGR03066 family)